MIIFRYLSKQILQVMAAVTLILLVVALTSRFIQYLSQAVAGELASDILLLLMLYRLPDFLLVILPLALFLGILLAYGRMYADNEMVILIGCGFSSGRLLFTTLGTSSMVMIVMAVLSLQLAPWGVRNTEQLKESTDQLTELDLIIAGQFQSFGDGSRVTYAERVGSSVDGERHLQNVFVAVSGAENEAGRSSPRIIIAESARSEIDFETGARFMRLENVLQYDGAPGALNFSIGKFNVQSILLPVSTSIEPILREESLTTAQLIGSDLPEHQAELQWRLSMLLLIPIITTIAVPLSNVGPRQGRFNKLVPAAVLYAIYFVLLQVSKDLVAEESVPVIVGMWWVHGLFASVAFICYQLPRVGSLLGFKGH